MQIYRILSLIKQFNNANDVENDDNEKRNFVIDKRIYKMRVDENFQSAKEIENS